MSKTKKPKPQSNETAQLPMSKQDTFVSRVLKASRDPWKFDADAKYRACVAYANFGVISKAAEASGVCAQTIYDHLEKDEDFLLAWESSKQLHRDMLEMAAYQRAVEGVEEPIIGGKERDTVVCYVKKYSDRLLELLLKKNNPEFREKQQLDVSLSGGVLVVGAALSEEDWEKQARQQQLPVLDGKTGEVVKQ